MANKKKRIDYTSREFNSIRSDLIEYAKRYYPESHKDFSEGSFGSEVIDNTSYVGDLLSYYLDYSVNESFIDTSVEYNNVLRHGRALGYKFRGNQTSFGVETFYLIVPANSTGLGPDMNYVPVLLKGSELGSTSGNGFMLRENVDFSNSNNEVLVAEVNETTGVPTSYAIKAFGSIISGQLVEELITISDYQKFLKVRLSSPNIAEIISVTDDEGHEYYEVETLSQNVIYRSVVNKNVDKDLAPEILKPVAVTRRFVFEQEDGSSYLQFGYGSDDEIKSNNIVDPKNVALQMTGKNYITDDSFDPSKLLATDKFGVAPSNTTLRIVARTNSSDSVNASYGTIVEAKSPIFEFSNISSLNRNKVNSVMASLECINEEPIVGDISLPDTDELRVRILDSYSSQKRAVTAQDYKSVIYNMPPQFGGIKRCHVVQDNDSFKRNINIYVISEDANGNFIQTNNTIKQNLKSWLQNKKMINDSIDILDAYVANIGIEFEIIARDDVNRYSVLSEATEELVNYFNLLLDIGEPFYVTAVYQVLKNLDSVLDVTDVQIINLNGGNYSDVKINIEDYMNVDGRYLRCPENIVYEIKNPRIDIKGKVK